MSFSFRLLLLAGVFVATVLGADDLSARRVVTLEARLNFSLWITDLYYNADEDFGDDEVVMVTSHPVCFSSFRIHYFLGVWQSVALLADANETRRPVQHNQTITYHHCAKLLSQVDLGM